MSELVPFFDEDEQLDDNLLRSIETLLDDNDQSSNGLSCEQATSIADDNGMAGGAAITPPTPSAMPQFQSASGSFAFGNQVYQKWSSNESSEQPATGIKRHFPSRNPSRPANYVKPVKKNTLSLNALQAMRASAEIAQYQAMLAEKANQLLAQYLRLNYEHLNAQAQILGIPLEQYIRNLLIALNNQSFLMPPQPFMFTPFNPMYMQSQTQSSLSPPTPPSPSTATQQRAWPTKQYFPKKN